MRLTAWLGWLALMVMAGGLMVAQRTQIVLKGYGIGERLRQVHDREIAVALMDTRLRGLQSPTTLARIAEDQQLKLVAWSRISQAGVAGMAGLDERPAQLAAWDQTDDTSD